MCSSKLIGALFVLAGLAAHAQPPDVPALHAALESGRFEEGLSLASAMIRTRPNDPGLWTARGLALAGMNQAQQSLASFDRALALNPKFVPALRAAAQTAYQQKDPRAAGYLKRLLALEPANEAAHGMAAVTAFDRSDCQQAVAHFALSGSRAQADPLAASMYAQCLLRLNRASLAVDVLAASLSAHPSRHDLRYNLAVAQSAADQTEGALQTLAGLDSSSAALTLIGMLRVKSGDVEGAVAALTQAIRLTPADEQPYVELTLLCARRSNWPQARDVADEGLRRVPASARLHSIRGVCRLQLGDAEGAAADFDDADRLDPRRALGGAAQGLMLSDQGQPEEAVRRLRAALARQPGDPLLQFLLADALHRTGDGSQEAISLLQTSIAVRPGYAPAQALLGKLYRQQGSTGDAIRHLETALRIDPANRQASQQLILALRHVGRRTEADRVSANLSAHLNARRIDSLTIERPPPR